MNGNKEKDLPAFISHYTVASSEKVVFIQFDSVMFVFEVKLCFWNVVLFGEIEINFKKIILKMRKMWSLKIFIWFISRKSVV